MDTSCSQTTRRPFEERFFGEEGRARRVVVEQVSFFFLKMVEAPVCDKTWKCVPDSPYVRTIYQMDDEEKSSLLEFIVAVHLEPNEPFHSEAIILLAHNESAKQFCGDSHILRVGVEQFENHIENSTYIVVGTHEHFDSDQITKILDWLLAHTNTLIRPKWPRFSTARQNYNDGSR